MTAPCSRLPQHRGLRLVPFPPPQLLLLLLLAAVGPARGWESGDLELFDLVEEVQLNFYQFLGVQQVSGDAGPPEGGASGTETCGSRRKGGGGAGFALVSSERTGTAATTWWSSWALAALVSRSTEVSPRYPSLTSNCPPPLGPLRPVPLLKLPSLSDW